MNVLILIAGLALLIAGGEFLVKGAVNIALKARISPLIIGLTIVSMGTSAPELLVSIQAVLSNSPDIATGNVIGSNIANIALVLGLTALVFPMVADKNVLRFDWPFMMGISIVYFLLILDSQLIFWEGILLTSLLAAYLFFLFFKSKKDRQLNDNTPDDIGKYGTPLYSILFIILGCTGLIYGSEYFLKGATALAINLGVDENVIGLTIVAFGTSVPELTTSLIAAFKKQTDISVGNLIGSNIFNLLGVIGITTLIHPIQIEASKILDNDIYWMLGIAAIVFPILFFGQKISRTKGALLFFTYCLYVYLNF